MQVVTIFSRVDFLGWIISAYLTEVTKCRANAQLEQADGTSWMGMYALNMMDMALEIAMKDKTFEDTATKFFEQFVLIAEALNQHGIWNDEDKFFYDTLSIAGSHPTPSAHSFNCRHHHFICRFYY